MSSLLSPLFPSFKQQLHDPRSKVIVTICHTLCTIITSLHIYFTDDMTSYIIPSLFSLQRMNKKIMCHAAEQTLNILIEKTRNKSVVMMLMENLGMFELCTRTM